MEIDNDRGGGIKNPVSEVLLVVHGEGGPEGGLGTEAPDGVCQAGQTPGQHDGARHTGKCSGVAARADSGVVSLGRGLNGDL